jgi:hypothetical protein
MRSSVIAPVMVASSSSSQQQQLVHLDLVVLWVASSWVTSQWIDMMTMTSVDSLAPEYRHPTQTEPMALVRSMVVRSEQLVPFEPMRVLCLEQVLDVHEHQVLRHHHYRALQWWEDVVQLVVLWLVAAAVVVVVVVAVVVADSDSLVQAVPGGCQSLAFYQRSLLC